MSRRNGPWWILSLGVAALLFAGTAGGLFAGGSGRGFLGVHIEEETENEAGGARVVRVIPESAAEQAGLREGDVIQGIDGSTVRGPGGLGQRLEELEPGDRVTLRILRDGGEQRVDVELMDGEQMHGARWNTERLEELGEHWAEWGERFGDEMEKLGSDLELRFADPDSHAYSFAFGWGRPRLGVQLIEPTPELREHLGGERESGVLVSKVLAGMPAEDAGIRVGDLIVAVEGREIADSGDLVRSLREVDEGRLSIEVIRDGRRLALDASLPALEDAEATGPRAYFRFAPPAPPAPPAPTAVRPALVPLPREAPPAPPAPPAPSYDRVRDSV